MVIANFKPRGGLQFIGGPYAHCYTIGESRLWFPCVDSNTELSTWTLEFTVDARLTGRVQLNRSFLTTRWDQPGFDLSSIDREPRVPIRCVGWSTRLSAKGKVKINLTFL